MGLYICDTYKVFELNMHSFVDMLFQAMHIVYKQDPRALFVIRSLISLLLQTIVTCCERLSLRSRLVRHNQTRLKSTSALYIFLTSEFFGYDFVCIIVNLNSNHQFKFEN